MHTCINTPYNTSANIRLRLEVLPIPSKWGATTAPSANAFLHHVPPSEPRVIGCYIHAACTARDSWVQSLHLLPPQAIFSSRRVYEFEQAYSTGIGTTSVTLSCLNELKSAAIAYTVAGLYRPSRKSTTSGHNSNPFIMVSSSPPLASYVCSRDWRKTRAGTVYRSPGFKLKVDLNASYAA